MKQPRVFLEMYPQLALAEDCGASANGAKHLARARTFDGCLSLGGWMSFRLDLFCGVSFLRKTLELQRHLIEVTDKYWVDTPHFS